MTTLDEASPLTEWPLVRIGDLFESWGGHTPSKADTAYWGPGLPWVSSQDVKAPRQTKSTHSVTQQAVADTGLRICPVGSVLVVVRSGILAHTLPVSVTELPVTINQDLKAFYSAEPYLNEWLALFLRMSARELLASSRRDGTTVQSIQYPLLKSTTIPLPPTEERKQIIDAVRQLLAKQVGTASQLAEARHAALQLRRSVVAAACTGRLTTEWRQEQGITQVGGSADELPPSWARIRLGDLAQTIRGGSTEVPENAPTGFPVLRSSSVRPFTVDYDDIRYLSASQSGRPENYLQEGDLLITRLSGSIDYVGNCSIVRGLGERRIQYPDRLFCCRLLDSRQASYVELAFAGPEVRAQIEAASRSAAGHQRISIADLKHFQISLPPIDEQSEIVRRSFELLSAADALLGHISRAAAVVDRTSHAILAKAFRGELSMDVEVEAGA